MDTLNGLCKSPFWDSNLTWYTDSPEFTACFHNTALVWIPCSILWLLSPLQFVLVLKSKVRSTRWTKLFSSKLGIVMVLNVLCVANLIHSLSEGNGYYIENIGSVFKLGSYILVILHLLLERIKAVQPSFFLLFYWLITAISETITVRWRINNSVAEGVIKNRVAFTLQTIQYCLIIGILALSFLKEKETGYACVEESQDSKTLKESPEASASAVSRLTSSWLTDTIWRAWKTPLKPSDIFDLLHSEKTLTVSRKFGKFFKYALNEKKTPHEENDMEDFLSQKRPLEMMASKESDPSIAWPLLRAFGIPLFQTVLLRVIADALLFSNPYFIRLLIEFTSNDEPLWKGILYASLMFSVNVAQCLISQLSVQITTKFGVRLKSALVYALYQKILKISYNARDNLTVGKIVNTMAVDASKFDTLAKEMNPAWSSPCQIAISFYFLWAEIGVAAIAGVFITLVALPLNTCVANKFKILQEKLMKMKDKRVKVMSEALNGIRVLKMYAWEKSFDKILLDFRQEEFLILRKQGFLTVFLRILYVSMPFMVCFSSFFIYLLQDDSHVLTPSKAFLCLMYFFMLKRPLNDLPEVISKCVMVRVSIQRISSILYCNEYQDYTLERNIHPYDIVLEDASFRWSKGLKPTLNEISFSIPKGSLVALVGPVGCGKSSLLAALLKEMDEVQGEVTIQGSIGYVPQQAWIFNTTFRENITLLKSLDETRYQQVIKACALEIDLKTLPAHDNTEIGENGINLSGGQKQRVSLARAVYLDNDIYLLDDPLAAVDSHVGRHIFEQVIGINGMLKDKTRILVLNNLSFLPHVDQIFYMNSGRIVENGTFDEIMNRGGEAHNFLMNHMDADARRKDNFQDVHEEHWVSLTNDELQGLPRVGKDQSKLISEENVEKGTVSFVVYRYYFQEVGALSIFFGSVGIISHAAISLYASYWLSLWSEDANTNGVMDTSLRNWRLTIYGICGFGQTLGWGFGSFILVVACLRASLALHSRMLNSVFHSPTNFFDTTPTGRVLNRFSRDIDVVDSELPLYFRATQMLLYEFVVTIIGVCMGIPILLIPVMVTSAIFIVLQRFYVAVSRQLKRITAVKHSFVLSHFSTTLSGITVIRACRASSRFLGECHQLIDNSLAVFYLADLTENWLNVRMAFVGNFLLFCTAVFAVVAKGSLSPGIMGFILSNVNLVLQTISPLVKRAIGFENSGVSVERIHEYCQLPSEAPWETLNLKLSASWPEEGRIEFRQVSARYREGLDLVLNRLSFEIRAKEKIAIVGRTGAGKSSITQALFRIIEPVSGQILIDDVDICQMGLHDLRSRLTIIPQDPVLFSGPLRLNLDPFNKYSDGEIWSALEHSHLKPFVKSLKKGLDHEIAEGGNNLSVGQRQLVCLTRALLRRTTILVLDEATASVDSETDELIQRTIRQEFSSSTVLTIAHRLNTIMDYDRVLVLDCGKVLEFDAPSVLLQSGDSVFYSLAKSANLVK